MTGPAADLPAWEEDVRRLDVAVDHAARVRVGEPLGDAGHEREALLEAELAPREALGEVLTIEPLNREVRRARVDGAAADATNDRRVIERCEREGLATEAVF